MERSKNFSNIERLIEVTSTYLKDNNLLDLEGGYRGASHFKNIIENYFSCSNENAIQNLYVKWNRNDGNFRDRVFEKVLGKQTKFDINQEICIVLNQEECFELMRFKSNGLRPKLLASANHILCKKIQFAGIKCGFKLKSNIFSNAKRMIPGHNFWRGVFKCIKCGNEMVGKIETEPRKEDGVLIKLEWNGVDCLIKAPTPKIQIRGEERVLMLHEIAAKGVTNFKTEAFISGSFTNLMNFKLILKNKIAF